MEQLHNYGFEDDYYKLYKKKHPQTSIQEYFNVFELLEEIYHFEIF